MLATPRPRVFAILCKIRSVFNTKFKSTNNTTSTLGVFATPSVKCACNNKIRTMYNNLSRSLCNTKIKSACNNNNRSMCISKIRSACNTSIRSACNTKAIGRISRVLISCFFSDLMPPTKSSYKSSYNIVALCDKVRASESAVAFLREQGILNNSATCATCLRELSEVHRKPGTAYWYYSCSTCKTMVSIRYCYCFKNIHNFVEKSQMCVCVCVCVCMRDFICVVKNIIYMPMFVVFTYNILNDFQILFI